MRPKSRFVLRLSLDFFADVFFFAGAALFAVPLSLAVVFFAEEVFFAAVRPVAFFVDEAARLCFISSSAAERIAEVLSLRVSPLSSRRFTLDSSLSAGM